MSKRRQETYEDRRRREIRFFLRNGYQSEEAPQPNPVATPPIIDFVDLEEEMEVDELVNAPIQPVASSSGSVTHVLDDNSGATEVGILQQGIRQSQSQTDNHSQSASQILTASATVSSSIPVHSVNHSLQKVKDKLTNVIQNENRNATALVPVNDPDYLIRQMEEKLVGLLDIGSELKSCIVSTREELRDLKERAVALNKPGNSLIPVTVASDDSEDSD